MKKLIYGSLFLAILGVSACKKQVQEPFSEIVSKSQQLVDQIDFEGDTIYYEYYLENRRVVNPNYDLNDDRCRNIVEGKLDSMTVIFP